MKLIDLWKAADAVKMFIRTDSGLVEILDGPGYPVVNGQDASIMDVVRIKPASYPMHGNVLEVSLAMGKRHFAGYGFLEYLEPDVFYTSDNWQYESTEKESSTARTEWDIVSRKDSFPCMDCRYTLLNR